MPSITLRPFAKINLSLRVKDLRPDGFHEIQTLLQALDLTDELKIETRRGPFEIRCTAPGVPTDRTNLVWQAAQRLWAAAGYAGEPRDTVVKLKKQIPAQTGLGGGSSNAAAALLGLRRLWKLRTRDEQIHEIAAELGSDVPYFLIGGTALALGRGEEVYPLQELPRHWVVLVLPAFGIATKDAYAWMDARRGREGLAVASTTNPFLARFFTRDVSLANDLELPVIERFPIIGEVKRQLADLGALVAAMSGSGSAVFGIFDTAASAKAAVRGLKNTGARVRLAQFLSRQRR